MQSRRILKITLSTLTARCVTTTFTRAPLLWPMLKNASKLSQIGTRAIKGERWHFSSWASLTNLLQPMNRGYNLTLTTHRSSKDLNNAAKRKLQLKLRETTILCLGLRPRLNSCKIQESLTISMILNSATNLTCARESHKPWCSLCKQTHAWWMCLRKLRG
jgi:hypothetical protein